MMSNAEMTVHLGTNWDELAEACKASTGGNVRNLISRLNSPTMFNRPMDYTANRLHSTITSEDSLLTQLWFEANEFPYCKSLHQIYCEPEYALLMKLSALPWEYDVDETPYKQYLNEKVA